MNYFIKYILVVLLTIPSLANAQRHKKPQNLARYDFKKIHFGFSLGINALNFNINKNDNFLANDSLLSMLSQDQKGFNLGIVSNLRLGKYTDLRFIPTLVFGERILNYQFTDQNNESLKTLELFLRIAELYIQYLSYNLS